MIALFFEVTPRLGQEDRYLEIAGDLRPDLDLSGGVRFLNRYRSLSRPRTMLSHQLWQDEASLARWRAHGHHYGAQSLGRREVFEDYRLRVGAVVATAMRDGPLSTSLPSLAYNDPSLRPERCVAVIHATAATGAHATLGEVWRSVYRDGEVVVTASVADRTAGHHLLAEALLAPCVQTAHLVLVSRDYGMFDRGEAPQYFPPARGA